VIVADKVSIGHFSVEMGVGIFGVSVIAIEKFAIPARIQKKL
jgi:hypothetical protein